MTSAKFSFFGSQKISPMNYNEIGDGRPKLISCFGVVCAVGGSDRRVEESFRGLSFVSINSIGVTRTHFRLSADVTLVETTF